jgi:hypothetical protein
MRYLYDYFAFEEVPINDVIPPIEVLEKDGGRRRPQAYQDRDRLARCNLSKMD